MTALEQPHPARAVITIDWTERHRHIVTVDARRYGTPKPGQTLAELVLESIRADADTPATAARFLGADVDTERADRGTLTVHVTEEAANPAHDPTTVALVPDLEPDPTITTRTETHW